MKSYRIALVVAMLTAACGGADTTPADESADVPGQEPAAEPAPEGPTAPSGPLDVPDWYAVDHDARSVRLSIVAGATPDNNYWNYNGYTNGQITITVPEGYAVEIEFENRDPNMAHSLGISSELRNFTVPPQPVAVFPGSITENPQSMVDATMPGESEAISFVADAAGRYSMVCYIAGHTAVGMWVFFDVSAEGEAGVRGP